VTVAKVEVIPMDKTLAVVGSLSPMDEATIAAQVEGLVEKTLVDFGSHVAEGAELALVDTASYEALTEQAAANVARSRANSLNAEQNLKRVRELQASQISSASDFDIATAQSEQARADVRAAEAAMAIARLNLDRSRVKAPFSGSISERLANVGDYVKTGTPMFRLVNDIDLKFIVQAPERYAGQVREGQTVRFSVDAAPGRAFEGAVFLVSPSVNPASRSFNLAARVPNADRALKANTFARGEILLEKDVPTATVPIEAVLNFAGVNKVYVIDRGVAKAREVVTGRVRNNKQEILGGLKPGEVVAIGGVTKLYENAPVRLLADAR
jgi:membrane fusion protein (multidrug efflux system)